MSSIKARFKEMLSQRAREVIQAQEENTRNREDLVADTDLERTPIASRGAQEQEVQREAARASQVSKRKFLKEPKNRRRRPLKSASFIDAEDVKVPLESALAPVYVPKWGLTTNEEPYNDMLKAAEVTSHCVFPRDIARMLPMPHESFKVNAFQNAYQHMVMTVSAEVRLQKVLQHLSEARKANDELQTRVNVLSHEKDKMFLSEQHMSRKLCQIEAEWETERKHNEELRVESDARMQKLTTRLREMELMYGTEDKPGAAIKRACDAREWQVMDELIDVVMGSRKKGFKDALKLAARAHPGIDLDSVHFAEPLVSSDDEAKPSMT